MGCYGLYLCVDSDQIMSISVAMLASNPQKIQYIFKYYKYVKNYGAENTWNQLKLLTMCQQIYGVKKGSV